MKTDEKDLNKYCYEICERCGNGEFEKAYDVLRAIQADALLSARKECHDTGSSYQASDMNPEAYGCVACAHAIEQKLLTQVSPSAIQSAADYLLSELAKPNTKADQ